MLAQEVAFTAAALRERLGLLLTWLAPHLLTS
jgi:hypothetical protein